MKRLAWMERLWTRTQARQPRRCRLELETLEDRSVPSGVQATYSLVQDWGSGFQGQVKLVNQQSTAIADWNLQFDFNANISSIWDARIVSHSANHYSVSGAGWNNTLAAGGEVSFGFVAGPGPATAPEYFVLNGTSLDSATPAPTPSPGPSPTPNPTPSSAGDIQFRVTSDWGSGFNGQIDIHNSTTTAKNNWSLEFNFTGEISAMWNADIVSRQGSHFIVKNAGWNQAIAAGAMVSIGFTGSPGNVILGPTDYVLREDASPLSGGGSTGTGGETPPPPAPTAGATHVFAPYVDMTLYPTFDLAAATRDQGIKNFSLAFIVADANRQPSWGGYAAYEINGGAFDMQMRQQVQAVRALGGDVIVSFGGANGQELAQVVTDVNALKNAYQSVINAYQLTQLDFDIEGGAAADRASIDRRSQALALLQQDAAAAGRTLGIWLTLPVLPTGLTIDGVYVVQSALHHGVQLGGVNIMAMDYGDSAAPNPQGRMGEYAIDAAMSLFGQLKTQYGSAKSDAQLWQMVGVTPMIGRNDVPSEVFDQEDARQLLAFAQQYGLGRLAMWSLNRDRQDPAGALGYASPTSSSILQQPYEFASIFKVFGG